MHNPDWLNRYYSSLMHHGIKGQKWGVKNGPPYPLKNAGKASIIKEALDNGSVSKKVNREKQLRHTKNEHIPGRSYINGGLDYAQELVDKLSDTGSPVFDRNGNWRKKERVATDETIGAHVDNMGKETETNKATIVYSKTGTHIYPRKDDKDD